MNILTIAWKNIRQNLKRPITLILLVLLPLVLMVILGTALSGVYSAGEDIDQVNLGVRIVSHGSLSQGFAHFIENQDFFTTTYIDNEEHSFHRLGDGEYEAIVFIDSSQSEIELMINDNAGISAGITESVLRSFLQSYSMVTVIESYSAGASENISLSTNRGYVTAENLEGTGQPRAIDYWGIMLFCMVILWGSFVGAAAVADERDRKTLSRIAAAPVSRFSVFAGLFLGALFSLIIQMALVFLGADLILGVRFGEHILSVIILFGSLCVFSLSLGIALGSIFPDPKTSFGLLNPIVHVLVFLGGGYFPVPDNKFFNIITKLSPMTWVKNAVFAQSFGSGSGWFFPAVFICFAGAFVFTSLSAVKLTKGNVQ
ncbi:MAG: ABC transporter permease [Spirochaetia bacterium]